MEQLFRTLTRIGTLALLIMSPHTVTGGLIKTYKWESFTMASNDFARNYLGSEFRETYPALIANQSHFKKSALKLIAARTQNKDMAHDILDAVLIESQRLELDPVFVLAQIEKESRFNTFALGTMGERGLIQIKPSIAIHIACEIGWRCDLKNEDLNVPAINIRLGLSYLMSLKKKAKTYEQAFTDAYNMGPTRLNQQIREGRTTPSSYSQGIQSIMVGFYAELSGVPSDMIVTAPKTLVAAE